MALNTCKNDVTLVSVVVLISLGAVLKIGENPLPTPALFNKISISRFSKEEYILS